MCTNFPLVVANLQIIPAFLAAGVNALKLSVQKCEKLSKICQILSKIGPKMLKIIQIWSKNFKKSQISQLFLPARLPGCTTICTSGWWYMRLRSSDGGTCDNLVLCANFPLVMVHVLSFL